MKIPLLRSGRDSPSSGERKGIVLYFTNTHEFCGANFETDSRREERSVQNVLERRVTKKLAKIRPPEREAK